MSIKLFCLKNKIIYYILFTISLLSNVHINSINLFLLELFSNFKLSYTDIFIFLCISRVYSVYCTCVLALAQMHTETHTVKKSGIKICNERMK
jgi:hypothetical protein